MCREKVVYCQLRLRYCYRATVIRLNEQFSFNIIKKVVKCKATIQPFATKKIMADDSNEEETGSQRTPEMDKK
jgi:hypothetical protein